MAASYEQVQPLREVLRKALRFCCVKVDLVLVVDEEETRRDAFELRVLPLITSCFLTRPLPRLSTSVT